jgi:hypothetical protein
MRRNTVPCGFSLVMLVCSAALSAQSNRSSFHLSGTIMVFGNPAGNNTVTFEGPSQKSVQADLTGYYEAVLPLGIWKVAVTTISPSGKTVHLSRPRVFRVTESMNVTIDLYVNGVGCAGVKILTPDGRPPTPQQLEAKNEACQGREFFPLPSDDGVPFEVVVGGRKHNLCSLRHEGPACEREFGTYNLLTVYADKVTFSPFPNGGLLEAKGNVVVEDGGRQYQQDSAGFLISGGQAVKAY